MADLEYPSNTNQKENRMVAHGVLAVYKGITYGFTHSGLFSSEMKARNYASELATSEETSRAAIANTNLDYFIVITGDEIQALIKAGLEIAPALTTAPRGE